MSANRPISCFEIKLSASGVAENTKKAMRYFLLLVIVVAPWRPAFCQVAAIEQSRAAYQQGVQAYKTGDYSTSVKHFEKALALRPSHPGLMYTLASASALNGDVRKALALLSRVADMGLAYNAADDPDLASLKNSDEFVQLLARFEHNRQPIANSRIAFSLPEKDLITEGLTYDPGSENFFVSSVRKRKIVVRSKAGVVRDFIEEAAEGIWSVFALNVDSTRNSLWASSSVTRQMQGYSDSLGEHAAIFEFDLSTGALKRKFLLPEDNNPHVFGDFVLHSSGDLYVSDSKANQVYRLSPDSGEFERLPDPGHFASLQGIAFSADEKTLFAADYAQGLFRIDVAAKTIAPLPHPENICVLGIDGLYFHRGDLIATQNGIRPHRVVRLTLNAGLDRIESGEVLEANHPVMEDPTLGCISKGVFYFIANSQWGNFDDKGQAFPPEMWQEPVVLGLDLKL